MNILVVAPNWIGDAIMAQPLLRLLRERQPGARIVALAPPHVAPVLEAMPEIARVECAAFGHGKLQWRERIALARKLREFDCAYVLPNSLKSALIPWLARIPERIGYRGEARYLLVNRRLPNPERSGTRPPMARFYAELAFIGVADGTHALDRLDFRGTDRPRLRIDEANVAIAKAKFLGSASLTVGFCPGAEYGPAKRWPAAHFAQLATLIAKQYPQAQIVCLGGPKDHPIAEDIVHASGAHVLNLCGHTTLTEAMALMKSLRAVVTNDSGLMHVAAALDVPLVALYGSTDPHHTPPHSPLAAVARIDIACSPCYARECPLGHFKCMNELSPERVWHDLSPRLAARGLITS